MREMRPYTERGSSLLTHRVTGLFMSLYPRIDLGNDCMVCVVCVGFFRCAFCQSQSHSSIINTFVERENTTITSHHLSSLCLLSLLSIHDDVHFHLLPPVRDITHRQA